MNIINQDLLASDKEHAVFSPSVLIHLRQHPVSYVTYLNLLTQDMMQGLEASEWGDRLADEGSLTIARDCWVEAGLSPDEINEKYQHYETYWTNIISSSLTAIQEIRNKIRKLKELKGKEHQLYYSQEAEAEKYAEKGWYDLAREIQEQVKTGLEQLYFAIEQQHEQDRTDLLEERDQLLRRMIDPTHESSMGVQERTAAQRLLSSVEQHLEPSQWNLKAARRRLDEARTLCEGGVYDPVVIAQILGEKLPSPKVAKKEETEFDYLSLFPHPKDPEEDVQLEVPPFLPSEPNQESIPLPISESVSLPIPESASSQAEEQVIYPQSSTIDSETELREESISIQREAEKERSASKNFVRAEKLFKKALQLWHGNETASKNYATMLRHLGRTRDAITVLEEGVQYAQERLPIYNQLTNYCTDIGQYDKARDYGHKALRLVGDPRAEIGVLTNLYTLEIKDQDYRKALEIVTSILRLNTKHEQMHRNKKRLEEMLAGVTQPVENLYETPDTITELNIEISPLIREDLENCELTKVSPKILHNQNVFKVLDECKRLQDETRKLSAQQYRERADYFLQSAKLVSQFVSEVILPTADEQKKERFSENAIRNLEKELGDALGTYTGLMGDRYFAQGNMDSARDYYLEHVRVFRQTLPLLPRRRIARYFQTFIPESIDLFSKVPDNEHRQANSVILELIESTIKEGGSGIHEDIARGILELACTSHLIVSYITSALRSNADLRGLFQPLIDILVKQQNTHQSLLNNLSSEQPEDAFLQLVNNRQVSIRQQESQLSSLIGSMGDKYRLQDASRELTWFTDHQREWSPTDRGFFSSLRELVRESSLYFYQEGQFTDREHLAHSIVTKADTLRKKLDDEPTSLGKTYITRIVYQLKRLIENAFQELQQTSLPRLVAHVVQTRWLDDNQVRECHVEVVNEGDSPAQEVNVHILPSETGDYKDDPNAYTVGTILARPHSATVAIPVHLSTDSDETTSKDAVDLLICLDYYDRERKWKKTPPTRLRLSLRDAVQFTRIENPYRIGQPITDRRMFVGRQELLDELSYEMARSGRTSAVVMYGQKRSGKTSILRNLEAYLSSQQHETYTRIISVYVSMQSVLAKGEWLTPGLFFSISQEVAQKCEEAGLGDQVGELTWEQLTQPPGAEIQFRTYLNRIRKIPSTRLVLLIDEFTELAENIKEGWVDRRIMKFLKSLIEQGFFSCVICGIDTMPQVLKDYSNELAVSDPRTIGYLSHDGARQLIEEPIKLPNGQSRYTSALVVEDLIRLTAGSPYYIQFVCQRLVDYMNRETRSPTITGADVDRVVSGLVSSLDPYTLFDNLTGYKSDVDQDSYNTTLEGLFLYLLADEAHQSQWATFSAICQRAPFVDETEFLNIADQLEDRQVIERSKSATRQYKIVVDLFRRWINVKRPMDGDALTRFRLRLEHLKG